MDCSIDGGINTDGPFSRLRVVGIGYDSSYAQPHRRYIRGIERTLYIHIVE